MIFFQDIQLIKAKANILFLALFSIFNVKNENSYTTIQKQKTLYTSAFTYIYKLIFKTQIKIFKNFINYAQ